MGLDILLFLILGLFVGTFGTLVGIGDIVQEIFSFPGGRRFHFRDPAGNILAVWSDKAAQSAVA